MSDSVNGWLSHSIGMPNAHPTTYLIALPIGAAMLLFGTLAALAFFAAVIGYVCMRSAARLSAPWGNRWAAAYGIGLFVLFNPWVYNEVVAGHLVMVLAYGGLVGLLAEMLCGRDARPVHLALWIALVQVQLQLFIPAMIAVVAFAMVTRKWLPVLAGVIVALPSIIGLIAERGTLLQTPYAVEWQNNQSVAPLPLLSLGGYFAGYGDRLGIAASVAVCIVLAMAVGGVIVARRSIAIVAATVAAAVVFVIVLGIHGPLALPYAWTVRNVPESGVFRELYDLAGVFAALVALLASAAASRFRSLSYLALAAGIALPVCWALHPPSDLWIPAHSYPHPDIAAPPFSRVALLPAFQPLSLRAGGGDGADPDAFVRANGVVTLNEYFPSFPVDMALARYEQSGNSDALRALGVATIVARPWLISRTRGAIGLAATSLQPRVANSAPAQARDLSDATPLMSECDSVRLAGPIEPLGTCDVFFGDAAGNAPVRAVTAPTDSIDPATAWIDARLAFGEAPELAQAIGGALTQSTTPLTIAPDSWLFAYVRGALIGSDGRMLIEGPGNFNWIHVPSGIASVRCAGTCELVAQTSTLPKLGKGSSQSRARALAFRSIAPWLYVVDATADSIHLSGRLLRFNERYDPAWTAFSSMRLLPHVRIDLSFNGWLLPVSRGQIVLVESTALLQAIAEIFGVLCVLWLLKALAYGPTKRVRQR